MKNYDKNPVPQCFQKPYKGYQDLVGQRIEFAPKGMGSAHLRFDKFLKSYQTQPYVSGWNL